MTIQRLGIHFLSLAALAVFSLPASAAKPIRLPAADPVGLFEALNAGHIDVKFIPENAAKGTVVVTNKSAKPLIIKLPEAFAGIPVHAQFGPANNNGPQAGNNSTSGGTQQLSGSFNNPGRGNNNPGPGIFSIAPEQVTKLKITSACLEFGKKTPHTRIPYQLAPLSAATSDPRIFALMNQVRSGAIDQPIAQAAAWHLANHLSWEYLSEKTGRRHLGGSSEPLFTSAQIARAQQVVSNLPTPIDNIPNSSSEN